MRQLGSSRLSSICDLPRETGFALATWITGCLVIASLWLLIYAAVQSQHEAAVEHTRQEAANLSVAFGGEVNRILDSVSETMKSIEQHIRADPSFSVYWWSKEMPLSAVAASFAVTFVGPDGYMRSTSLIENPGAVDLRDRDYFQKLVLGQHQGLFVGAPVIGRISHQVTVQLARKVQSADGSLLGLLVFALAPNKLTTLYPSVNIGPHGRLVLIGTDQVIRARFGSNMSGPAEGVGVIVDPFPVDVPTDGSSVSYIRVSPVDGTRRVIGIRRVGDYGLFATVGLDLEHELRPVNATARQLLAIGSGFTIVLLVTLVLLARELRHRALQGKELAADNERHRLIEQRLRRSEARLDRAQEIAGIGSWELDLETGTQAWSRQMYRISGIPPDTGNPSLATLPSLMTDEDAARYQKWLSQIIAGSRSHAFEVQIREQTGQQRDVVLECLAIADPDGQVRRVSGTMQDVTERRQIERQLSQAQKMDAIGKLSGGIAHDFNNLLGVVMGNVQLLSDTFKDDPLHGELCDEALDAARRGAELIRRMLAFARRQPLRQEPTDVNRVIIEAMRLISRIIGEDVEVSLHLSPEVGIVTLDPVQLESAITNLATNARDAMPHGGHLTIAARVEELDEEYVSHRPDAIAGQHVVIEVSDTGIGMSSETASHAFEPFFTTKEEGRGTGLGLSMVFGFAKQSGGHTTIYSELGRGTTIRLYIPCRRHDAPVAAPPLPVKAAHGKETVLLVEDNADLRRATSRQLGVLGYKVIEAESGAIALNIIDCTPGIDLMLSDVVMPGTLDGIELAQVVAQRWPSIKILLMSGFSEVRLAADLPGNRRFRLISKPFNRDELGTMIREVLDTQKTAELECIGTMKQLKA